MPLALNRLILYAGDVEATVAFYEKHFGFRALRLPGDRIVELVAQHGGANIMVHAVAKGVKTGQVTVKLVFDVEDVAGFCEERPQWADVQRRASGRRLFVRERQGPLRQQHPGIEPRVSQSGLRLSP